MELDQVTGGGVRGVRGALDILSLLTEEQTVVSLRAVVEVTGLPTTTVLRLVQTLEQSGLLWATEAGDMAGPGLWRWVYLAAFRRQLPPESVGLLRGLVDRHGETVNPMIHRDVHLASKFRDGPPTESVDRFRAMG